MARSFYCEHVNKAILASIVDSFWKSCGTKHAPSVPARECQLPVSTGAAGGDHCRIQSFRVQLLPGGVLIAGLGLEKDWRVF